MRRLIATLAIATGLMFGTLASAPVSAAPDAAAQIPSPSAFCKKGIDAGTPPPSGYWVIQSATFVALAETHVTAKCIRTWSYTGGFLRCTQYVTLWWNGLWSYSALDCDRYDSPT